MNILKLLFWIHLKLLLIVLCSCCLVFWFNVFQIHQMKAEACHPVTVVTRHWVDAVPIKRPEVCICCVDVTVHLSVVLLVLTCVLLSSSCCALSFLVCVYVVHCVAFCFRPFHLKFAVELLPYHGTKIHYKHGKKYEATNLLLFGARRACHFPFWASRLSFLLFYFFLFWMRLLTRDGVFIVCVQSQYIKWNGESSVLLCVFTDPSPARTRGRPKISSYQNFKARKSNSMMNLYGKTRPFPFCICLSYCLTVVTWFLLCILQ